MEKIKITDIANMVEEEVLQKVTFRKEAVSTVELYHLVTMALDSATNPETGIIDRFFLDIIATVCWAIYVTTNVEYSCVEGEDMDEFCNIYDAIFKNQKFADLVTITFGNGEVNNYDTYISKVHDVADARDVRLMSNEFVIDTVKVVTEQIEKAANQLGAFVENIDQDRLMEAIEKFLASTSHKFPDFNNEKTLTLLTKVLSLVK